MYNNAKEVEYQKQMAMQECGNANSLRGYNVAGPIQSAPEQMPMSASAADLVGGLVELNQRLRTLRDQMFGAEPSSAGPDKRGGPNSLIEAVVIAGMELREAHALVNTILNRL
jgi:hypothetical protein